MILRPSAEDYARGKRVFNDARHPTFIGRSMFERCAVNGGALLFRVGGEDVGIALVNVRKNCGVAMAVKRSHQGRGIGRWMVGYTKLNWRRVTEYAVPYFEKLGYVRVGAPKRGRKLVTYLMVREGLIGLAGRVSRVLRAKTTAPADQRMPPDDEGP